MSNYLFEVGFAQQRWADVQLTFFNDALQLHRIVLSQSPYLAQHLGPPGLTVHLAFSDETITSEAVFACIHHLYSPALHLVNPENSRAVLVTAILFDIPELVQHAYDLACATIPDNVLEWVAWLSESGYVGQPEEWEGGRYGEWSSRLKQNVLDHLVSSPPDLATYIHLPYPLLKRALEAPELALSMQARFAFAKQVIAARKKASAAQGQDEAAVLAAMDGSMGVQITRRSRKKLWKVEG